MSKKMLIDASHPEETRVVIVNGSQIEELDFESQNKRQLRGNVYLARVTRVEPSLQAAFVEYGGNRHGFLAFSEIHPDYYQIPYEDRMALIEAEEEENRALDQDDDEAVKAGESSNSDNDDDDSDDDDSDADDSTDAAAADTDDADLAEDAADEADEEVAQEQAKTASTRRKRMSRRRYKIQEVIKRGQILLVQVVKEERGNKGAALTTYLSMAGRYCVLMPNTPRGGGISRKISNASDRKRIKSVVSEFDVPQGMGVIVRTAGAKRTKLEIKRDYDYLCRLWETTRNTTLKSIAPALIHEEGNLVKRSIRDLYNKDIDEVLVQGDEAYKTAKSFIKMLMPSHAKNVKAYKEPIPLFLRYQVESQIEDSLDSVVQLKSGGYLVIHPTEALVSVDVNSGRSTKERNVERTALKTNLEAAEEVARQMRLRDLAGLIVIDFIDMDENRNNRAVEKRMKDALAQDRARVQHSRISQFGLMEISRQRRRRSLLEGSTATCNHCDGVGRKRTIESSALRAIRAVEETGVRGRANRIRLKVAPDVALYIFNEKRDLLTAVDSEFNVFTELVGDDTLIRPAFEVEILEASDDAGPDPLIEIEKELNKLNREAQKADSSARRRGAQKTEDEDEAETKPSEAKEEKPSEDDDGSQKRRRRRGRRGGRRRGTEGESSEDKGATTENGSEARSDTADSDKPAGDKPKRRRRKPRSERTETAKSDEASTANEAADTPEADTQPKPKSTRRRAAPKRAPAKEVTATAAETAPEPAKETEDKPQIARSTGRRKAPGRKPKAETEAPATPAPTVEADTAETPKAKRAPRKKAAAPAAKAKTESAPRRRKAPSRKPAEAPQADAAPEEAPAKPAPKPRAKPKAKAAPKAAAAKKAAPARRKAPAAKPPAKAKTEAKPAAETKAEPKAKPAPKPKAAPKPKPEPAEAVKPAAKAEPAAAPEPQKKSEEKPAKPKKKGWFGRLKKD